MDSAQTLLSGGPGNPLFYVAGVAVLALAALATAIYAVLRVRTAFKPLSRVSVDSSRLDELLPSILKTVEECEGATQGVAVELKRHIEKSTAFVQHFGLVRYNAFEDISGQQSYSLCLLDGRRTGVLMTYLTGKNSTRSYAVTIENGQASRRLSDEEQQALDRALSREAVTAG